MGWEDIDTKPNLAHLGITATHVRRIKPGKEYEQYFDAPTGTTELINDDASVHDTLDFVKVLVNKTLKDTKKISQVLKRPTLEATCKSIFDFFYTHYQYKLDDLGVEQVRRPSRAWSDRKTGIDCDCFTASVSSVLTNLGIEHYLKIIAINGKENFQHIYVVIPKRSGLDINSRANYWVIDPVLNHNDEEAPTITKTKHLKMNGIPLQQLNGIEELAGLGNEFEGMDQELSGLNEESMGRVFRRRLLAHTRNSRAKMLRQPKALAPVYNPPVVVAQMKKLEEALEGVLSGTIGEAEFEGVLEHLSAVEHLAVLPQFTENYDAMHGHDDHLYGVLYGDVDDNMLSAVMGLGRKGRSKAKVKSGKKGKRGFFTKVKNADKGAKKGKFKGKLKNALKKVVRVIKKTSPLAIAARGGFIMAMRTNFAKIAEKAYWGYFTREQAKAKGITDEYYDACVAIKNKLLKVFVERLGGNESTLKKPIMNGRAAKKIAKLLKKKGMSGTTGQLFGLSGAGLGVVAAASSTATITAAMAFLAPIIKMISGMKGKKSGLEKDENGNESESTSENPDVEMEKTEQEANNPKMGRSSSTTDNDGSIEAADAANDEEPESGSDDGGSSKKKSSQSVESSEEEGSTGTSKGSKTGVLIALGVAGVAALAFALKSKSKQAVNGLGNFSAKRESKGLKAKLTKQGITMPHGYKVQKRKTKSVKTIKI